MTFFTICYLGSMKVLTFFWNTFLMNKFFFKFFFNSMSALFFKELI